MVNLCRIYTQRLEQLRDIDCRKYPIPTKFSCVVSVVICLFNNFCYKITVFRDLSDNYLSSLVGFRIPAALKELYELYTAQSEYFLTYSVIEIYWEILLPTQLSVKHNMNHYFDSRI